jgi:hypothetical protein
MEKDKITNIQGSWMLPRRLMITIAFISFMLIISAIIWEIEFPRIESTYVDGVLVEEHYSPFFVIAGAPPFFFYTVVLALYTSMAIVVFKFIQYFTKDPPEVYFKRFGAKEAISTYRYSNSFFYLMALLSVFAFVCLVIWITSGIIDILGSRILADLVMILISGAPALMLITISLAIIKHSRTKKDFDFLLGKSIFHSCFSKRG